MNLTGLYVLKRIIIYWHIFHSNGFHNICNIKCRLDCRYSPQNIFYTKKFNPHKKPISLLNVPICIQGMQRNWLPEAGTIIVTGLYWNWQPSLLVYDGIVITTIITHNRGSQLEITQSLLIGPTSNTLKVGKLGHWSIIAASIEEANQNQ